MNKYRIISTYFLVFFLVLEINAQVVGTPYMVPVAKKPLLDELGITPSFAFSTRKLRDAYTGPAMRIRRNSDNAEADVFFDTDDVVSATSSVTISVVGTSGLSIGQTFTLSAFKDVNRLFVSMWWDQGTNYYNGQQSTRSRQPELILNSAGAGNQYASLQFRGVQKDNVTVMQTLNTLLTNGIRGSVFINAKVLNGSTSNNSFGHSDTSNNAIRWSAHMNWPDGNNNMFTDLGSIEGTRSFTNNTSVGLNKYLQYTIIRYPTSKVVRTSQVNRNNTNLSNITRNWNTNSTFGVGLTTGSLDVTFSQNGFTGNMSEFVLYKVDLTAAQYQLLEQNQLSFWGSY